ncbi:ATP-dependent RNA helicase glh-2-like [Halyomorpha halys]|uniref:ATP-dependent RNA helicase glh-2-like n=1 Tax=Halyomorpha halys TaxID=286706 RepID=UPI0034D27B0F
MDSCAREEEARMEVEEPGWMRVEYNRPRNFQNFGRRRENRDSGRDRARYQENRVKQGKCHGCGKIGHLVAQCPRTRCFECGNEGHIAKQCPYIYKRREANLGEPMEVNAQRVRKNRVIRSGGSITESPGTSEASESELEEGHTRPVDTRRDPRQGWRRASERMRSQVDT